MPLKRHPGPRARRALSMTATSTASCKSAPATGVSQPTPRSPWQYPTASCRQRCSPPRCYGHGARWRQPPRRDRDDRQRSPRRLPPKRRLRRARPMRHPHRLRASAGAWLMPSPTIRGWVQAAFHGDGIHLVGRDAIGQHRIEIERGPPIVSAASARSPVTMTMRSTPAARSD